LKNCPEFEYAKNGDLAAARFVVQRCVKTSRIAELRAVFPNSSLLPVISRNALPLALAQEIGLPIWQDVYLVSTTQRKALLAIQRLLHKPVFDGYIQEGMDYIIVDDIITQGGTVSALREFVLTNGGRIVAVVALAFSIGSHYVAPTRSILYRLSAKFGYAIYLLQLLGIAVFEELTYSEIRYLLKFSSIRNIYDKLARAECVFAIIEEKQTRKKIVRPAVRERDEVEFSDELCYFPQPENRVKLSPQTSTNEPLTGEQRSLLKKWNDFTKKQQSQLLLEILRNMYKQNDVIESL
jgi:hypothetical protein